MVPPTSNSRRFVLPQHLWRLRPIQLIIIDLGDWLIAWAIINLLWVASCLTLILLPPAIAALFDTAHAAYHNQAPTPSHFFAAMRRWFAMSWFWAAINIVVLGALFALGRIAYSAEILLAPIAVLTVLVILSQFFFWPYMLMQERPSLLQAWRNSMFTILADLLYFALYLVTLTFLMIPSLIVIAPFLLISPAVAAMLITYSLGAWLEQKGMLNTDKREL